MRQERLFEITRSRNGNVVRYDVRLLDSGQADPEQPVVNYWILESGEREEVKFFERPAYGFDASCVDEACDEIVVDMVPEIGRQIRARRGSDGYEAVTVIDGRDALISRIFVKSKERFLRPPKVLHIDFEGVDVRDGQTRRERFVPDD